MNKRDFLIKYIFCRASTNVVGLDGPGAVREAHKAWLEIENLAPIKDYPDSVYQDAESRNQDLTRRNQFIP